MNSPKTNKWKTAFFICLTISIASSCVFLYGIVNQGVTISYMEEGYDDTQNDLKTLSKVINETNLSKTEILAVLSKSSDSSYFHLENDSVYLNKVMLIFKNDKLIKVSTKW